MSQTKILVVDDEEDLRDLVRYNLTKEGYYVTCAGSGRECLDLVRNQMPDLIVLDVMMPELDGLEVCKIIRRDDRISHIPIILLTARSEESDIVSGLELGADDYVTKPFSSKVLAARIKTVLRRFREETSGSKDKVLVRSGITINPLRREVLCDGEEVRLTYSEFELLQLLAKNPGRVLSRQQIINGIRGGGYPVTERAIDVQVVGLRKKLGDYGKMIDTIRGIGYRFVD